MWGGHYRTILAMYDYEYGYNSVYHCHDQHPYLQHQYHSHCESHHYHHHIMTNTIISIISATSSSPPPSSRWELLIECYCNVDDDDDDDDDSHDDDDCDHAYMESGSGL